MAFQSISSPSALTNGFGIYVHTPFCVHKCSYCDFYSFTRYQAADFATLTDLLCRELRLAADWLRRHRSYQVPVSSIFFGGGTPSLVPPQYLQEITSTIAREFPVLPEAEITIEANPETVTANLCQEWRDLTPFNRVSLGAQSFHATYLSKLERLGSAATIRQASRFLREAGFANFNLDLIFGIPGQTIREVLSDIESATALDPQHLSFYSLTLKEGHSLHAALPSEDLSADLFEAGIEKLSEKGFQQYEISNFSRSNRESRHNLLYWAGGDFLGVGPSAASRFFFDGRFHHRKQFSDYKKYADSASFPEPGFECSTPWQTILEATFLELRKNTGVQLDHFRDRYNYDLAEARNFPHFLKQGLIDRSGQNLKLTPRGRMLADRVTRDLVDELTH
jgi:oxygen-independent coproporphyrinogen-3 oxidase